MRAHAVRNHAHKMQIGFISFNLPNRFNKSLIFKKSPVVNASADLDRVLLNYPSGAKVHMASLAIA